MSKTLYTVVDENDNAIGAKTKAEISREELYRVAALWIVNSRGENLLAKRSLSKSHDPGAWGPAVAGTVEEHETYEQNIVKEIDEEIGLQNLQLTTGPKIRIEGAYNYFAQYFIALVDLAPDAFKPRPGEVDEVRWFTTQELEKLLTTTPEMFTPSMHQYFGLLMAFIQLRR